MPLPSSACDIPTDVCCTSLYDSAYHLLTELYDDLSHCYPPDPCGNGPLLAYVTHGYGDDGIRDALTVAILGVSTTAKSQDGQGRTIPLAAMRGDFEVRLRESGWPMVKRENDVITPPDPALQNELAKHSYAHGEKLYRKMRGLIFSRMTTPASEPQFSFSQLGPLIPLTPLGGVVGWTFRIQVDLVWNG